MAHVKWRDSPLRPPPRRDSRLREFVTRYRVPVIVVISIVLLSLGYTFWNLSSNYRRTRALVRDVVDHGWFIRTDTRRFRLLDKGFLSDFPDDVDFFGSDVLSVAAQGPDCNDAFLARLHRSHKISSVTIVDAPVTVQGIKSLLENTPDVRHLDLEGCPVGDDLVSAIVSLKKLESLILDRTQVSDRSLDALRSLPSLKYLSLRDTRMTDAALAGFKRFNPDGSPILADPSDPRGWRFRWWTKR